MAGGEGGFSAWEDILEGMRTFLLHAKWPKILIDNSYFSSVWGDEISLNDILHLEKKKDCKFTWKVEVQWGNLFMENARTNNFSAFPVSWWET